MQLEERFAAITLVARLESSGGAMDVGNVRQDVLAETRFFQAARLVLIPLWIALAFTVLFAVLRSAERRRHVFAAIMVGILLFAGTLMPRSFVRAGTDILKHGVMAIKGPLRSLSPSTENTNQPVIAGVERA